MAPKDIAPLELREDGIWGKGFRSKVSLLWSFERMRFQGRDFRSRNHNLLSFCFCRAPANPLLYLHYHPWRGRAIRS